MSVQTDGRRFFQKFWDFLTKKKCSSCKKSGGVKRNRTALNSREHLSTKVQKQEEKHYDHRYNHTGTSVKYINVTVPVRTTTYRQNYTCVYCNHEWSVLEEETKEL